MSYIDAIHSKNEDRIYVVERDKNGKRHFNEYPSNYIFYYSDPKGKHRSLYGDPVSRFSTRNRTEFEKERRIHSKKKLFESDVNVVARCLSENYRGQDAPNLHTCFLDIETAFDQERGFAPPEDPFNEVTAITVYLDWLEKLITMVYIIVL